MARQALQLDEFIEPEAGLQEAIAQAFAKLIRPPAEWAAYPAGHISLDGQQAAKLYRAGLRPNWPDFLVLHAGHLIGIEVKTVDGELSRTRIVRSRRSGRPRIVEGQRDVFPRLKAAGMHGPHVVRSVEHALTMLEAEGVPLVAWRIAA